MKIKNIKINQFGKIKNKEINFEKNIILIHGKNETGKSTLLKFIMSMFYGISKNKNKKEISDFEQYEPWQETEFSGKINYELDNGKCYEIFRDFRKKNPKIYNENSEDISKEYSIDKTKGSEFFKEQTGMEEELFYNTIVAEQEEVKLDKAGQNTLIQKMTNLVSAGSDNVSYKKTMEKLKNKLWEEVGTDRTTERPINQVEEKLGKLEKEYEILEKLEEKQYTIEETETQLKQQMEKQEELVKAIKEIKKQKEEENIENEIIRIKQKELQEWEQKQEQIRELPKTQNKTKKLSIVLTGIFTGIIILLWLINPIFLINILVTIFGIVLGGYTLYEIIKQKKEKQKQREEYLKQKKEQEMIEENIQNKKTEIQKLTQNLEEKRKKQEAEIKRQYPNLFLTNYLLQTAEEIKRKLEIEEENSNTLKLKWHEIELEKKNILPQIENMAQTQEQIKALQEEKQNLMSLATSIQLARQTLEEAYDEMKGSLTPQFAQILSETVEQISGGKYKKVKFSDEEGLLVEVENGEYKKAERLSVGTIFQMYLALRLAIAKEITEETMPIILDEAFAYYDDERLENILQYLAKTYTKEQIFMLTCTHREKELLEKNKIPFQVVEM